MGLQHFVSVLKLKKKKILSKTFYPSGQRLGPSNGFIRVGF